MSRLSDALFRWVLRAPRLAVLLLAVAVTAAATGLLRLEISNDIEIFFSDDSPELLAHHEFQDTYGQALNILLVVTPPDEDVFSVESLSQLAWLTEQAWTVPHSRRVDSVINYQHSEASEEGLDVAPLVDWSRPITAEVAARARTVALAEPTLVDRVISPDGRTAGVNITLHLPKEDASVEVPEVAEAAEALADQLRARAPGTEVHITGMLMISHAMNGAIQRDTLTLIPLMFALIAVFLGVMTRSLPGTVAALVVIAGSNLVAMGMAGWMGIVLSPSNLIAPIIIMALAIASSVHVLGYYAKFRQQGQESAEAALGAQRANLVPVFWTSVSTMLGFISMNASDSPPVRELGNIVCVGVATSMVLALLLLPALLLIFPQVSSRPPRSGRQLASLAEWVIGHRRPLLWTAGLVTVLGVPSALSNRLDDTFVTYFDEAVPFRAATDYAVENLTGFNYFEYSIASDGPVTEPGYLQQVKSFEQWWKTQPHVRHTSALPRVFERLHKNLNDDDPAFERLPDDGTLLAQYLLLFELSLPQGLDLTDQISVDRQASRLTVIFDDVSTQDMLSAEAAAIEWMEANWEGLEGKPTGQPLMFAHMSDRNSRNMLASNVLLLALISVMLIVPFRSLRIGIGTLMPNLMPALVGFAVWGLTVGQVGLAVSSVIGMTLGIVVDDTIHFTHKFLVERRAGATAEDAVRAAFAQVGAAMVATSTVLVVGFGVLSLSQFTLNSQMGQLTALILGFALVADFLFLPPLLMALSPGDPPCGPADASSSHP